MKRLHLAVGILFILLTTGFVTETTSQTKPPAPEISGDWTGTWASYNPAQGGSSPKDLCKKLDAKVELKDGLWQAVFEGDCGRPYKYSIKMEGRQVGKVVLFRGTTDLGEKDGGVFDWIGRANDKEFVGFFTSAFYTGVFTMARPVKPATQ
jgi:hypothetical protein